MAENCPEGLTEAQLEELPDTLLPEDLIIATMIANNNTLICKKVLDCVIMFGQAYYGDPDEREFYKANYLGQCVIQDNDNFGD